MTATIRDMAPDRDRFRSRPGGPLLYRVPINQMDGVNVAPHDKGKDWAFWLNPDTPVIFVPPDEYGEAVRPTRFKRQGPYERREVKAEAPDDKPSGTVKHGTLYAQLDAMPGEWFPVKDIRLSDVVRRRYRRLGKRIKTRTVNGQISVTLVKQEGE